MAKFPCFRLLLLMYLANVHIHSQEMSTNDSSMAPEIETTTEDDISEEEMTSTVSTTAPPPRNLCPGIKHRSEFSFTCCAGEMYPAGVNLDAKFQECYGPPKGLEATVHDAFWHFYTCLTGDVLNEDVTLVKFADKYTEMFPLEIRSQILSKAEAMEAKVAKGNFLQLERAVRHYYHHIEREVCEGIVEDDPADVLTSCKDSMDMYREEVHARGGCCHKKTTPLPIEFLRRPPTEPIRECTERTVLSILVNETYYLGLDFDQSDAQQFCQTACTLKVLGLTDDDNFDKALKPFTPSEADKMLPWYDFNATKVFESLTRIFSDDWKRMLHLDFEDPWNHTRKVEERHQDQFNQFWKIEYNQLIEFSQVERLFTMCAAYNEVVMELEKILYYDCNDSTKK